jgi:hypothetical protein
VEGRPFLNEYTIVINPKARLSFASRTKIARKTKFTITFI